MVKVKMDAETKAFAEAVLMSIQEAKRGEGRVTLSEQFIPTDDCGALDRSKSSPKPTSAKSLV